MSESHVRDDYEKIINKCKANFENHKIETVLSNDKENVYRFLFRQSDTWCFGMELTFAPNLIVVTGDCGDILLAPGYGRCGLSFLKGSIGSYDYLLGKSPFHGNRNPLKDYSYNQAMQNLKYEVECGSITGDDIEEAHHLDDYYFHGMYHYYEFCHDKEIDEPCSPEVFCHSTLNMIAGLMVFVNKYNEICGECK